MIQFIKGGFDYGELHVADRLPNFTLEAFGRGRFITQIPPGIEDVSLANAALQAAKDRLANGKCDVLILDEINVALELQLVSLEDVLRMIKEKPKHVELVLTGRYAPKEILEIADLVTEMKQVKHPFEKGDAARKGIEF